jgi:3-methyladenine DNA glycosylase AlkC
MTTTQAPAPLKQSMGEQQFHMLATVLQSIEPAFDGQMFLTTALDGLDSLTLMERIRRASVAIDAGARTLPGGYDTVLTLLMKAAPLLGRGFVSLVAPDYIGQYGRHAFDRSMDALKYFTPFGSSEFAVREFLRDDVRRALSIMEVWSQDADDAVRRLASEGSRPRLPWSFRLREIEADPSLAARILDNLRADPSPYVRRSVANHLNDVTKTDPAWVLERAAQWGTDTPHSRWIVRHALRTLVKQGDVRALAALGAESTPGIAAGSFSVTPANIVLGETVTLACELSSTASKAQRLVVDYRIAYVKQRGTTAWKVFKLKSLMLEPGQHVMLSRDQVIRDFTTRTHYAGHHAVELIVNGGVVAQAGFDLA